GALIWAALRTKNQVRQPFYLPPPRPRCHGPWLYFSLFFGHVRRSWPSTLQIPQRFLVRKSSGDFASICCSSSLYSWLSSWSHGDSSQPPRGHTLFSAAIRCEYQSCPRHECLDLRLHHLPVCG